MAPVRAAFAKYADDLATFTARDGTPRVQDGPFADTRERVFVIDVPDLDAALAWAKRCPAAEWGSVEIRPVAVTYASAISETTTRRGRRGASPERVDPYHGVLQTNLLPLKSSLTSPWCSQYSKPWRPYRAPLPDGWTNRISWLPFQLSTAVGGSNWL
jgi:hypothetical protein